MPHWSFLIFTAKLDRKCKENIWGHTAQSFINIYVIAMSLSKLHLHICNDNLSRYWWTMLKPQYLIGTTDIDYTE